MPTYKKRPDFYSSDEGLSVLQTLQSMTSDAAYHTVASYSANSILYPNNMISFIDKHMVYLRDHPSLDPHQYIANLKLMTKIKN